MNGTVLISFCTVPIFFSGSSVTGGLNLNIAVSVVMLLKVRMHYQITHTKAYTSISHKKSGDRFVRLIQCENSINPDFRALTASVMVVCKTVSPHRMRTMKWYRDTPKISFQ